MNILIVYLLNFTISVNILNTCRDTDSRDYERSMWHLRETDELLPGLKDVSAPGQRRTQRDLSGIRQLLSAQDQRFRAQSTRDLLVRVHVD